MELRGTIQWNVCNPAGKASIFLEVSVSMGPQVLNEGIVAAPWDPSFGHSQEGVCGVSWPVVCDVGCVKAEEPHISGPAGGPPLTATPGGVPRKAE